MRKLQLRTLLATLLFSATALAQNTSPAPPPQQLSPKAAYDNAMHPLDVTRHSVANWSDVEIAALKVAMDRAQKDCAARDPKVFTGEALIDLVRLCSLGQMWPSVIQAATLYIAADSPTKPLLAQAYAGQIDADLHLKKEPDALASARTMLTVVPYDTLTAETIGEAISYMQFVNTSDALALATLRQPLLLALLQATAASAAAPAASASADEPPQSLHELYADGLTLPALQQLAKVPPADVAAALIALDAALPTTLTPDEAIPIAASRKRYALLGKPLPKIAGLSYLSMPGKLPQLPAVNALTALLLFPDWCAQCVQMGSQFPETVFTVADHEAYLYGLLAQTVPPRKPIPPAPGATAKDAPASTAFDPSDAANLLRETPTIVVEPALLDQFAATDVPLLLLTDAQGIVRVVQPVDEDALARGSTIDSAIARVGAQWPSPLLTPKKPASGVPAPAGGVPGRPHP
ncbi:hypothetical protein [Granulicella sp. S156]|uniref:hypothetical protein n=1 Tax=Granulicella sp. S156 TaxID=1747224 RepID=UPI00131E1D06|nr:hypothetical protein [Granulicella sp. S156]